MSDYMDVEDFESDLAQATSKVYWDEESSCMEETFGTVNRVIRELGSRVKVLSDLLSERPVCGPSDGERSWPRCATCCKDGAHGILVIDGEDLFCPAHPEVRIRSLNWLLGFEQGVKESHGGASSD